MLLTSQMLLPRSIHAADLSSVSVVCRALGPKCDGEQGSVPVLRKLRFYGGYPRGSYRTACEMLQEESLLRTEGGED